jgi:hypothetical protein
MSYCFDTLAAAWDHLRSQLPAEVRDDEVAMRFGFLLEELHEADHRLHGAVNRDDAVTGKARKLDDALVRCRKAGAQ